uniref:HAT C-terminal dimerisation domain-containing protein n=1 Tax=Sinocyclocheilus rhinocerous TaxID=307959 RepID=A0A673NAR4_9TELE
MAHCLHLVVSGEATCTISKDEASLSCVIPCVQALKATLGNLEADAAVRKLPDAKKLTETLKTQLDSQFESAMLLDPRFKRLPKSLLGNADFSRLKESVITEVEYEMTEGHSAAASATTYPTTDEPVQSDSLFWGAMLTMAQESNSPTNSATFQMTASADIECYLSESFSVSLTSDPVATYWSNQATKNPELAHIALKYLTCPPTSVSSERLFSTAGDIAYLLNENYDSSPAHFRSIRIQIQIILKLLQIQIQILAPLLTSLACTVFGSGCRAPAAGRL